MSYYDDVNAHDFYIVSGYNITGLSAAQGYNPMHPNPVQKQPVERIFIKKDAADDFVAELEGQLQEWVKLYRERKVNECDILETVIDQEKSSPGNLIGTTVIKDYILPRIRLITKGSTTYRVHNYTKLPGWSSIKWEEKIDVLDKEKSVV